MAKRMSTNDISTPTDSRHCSDGGRCCPPVKWRILLCTVAFLIAYEGVSSRRSIGVVSKKLQFIDNNPDMNMAELKTDNNWTSHHGDAVASTLPTVAAVTSTSTASSAAVVAVSPNNTPKHTNMAEQEVAVCVASCNCTNNLQYFQRTTERTLGDLYIMENISIVGEAATADSSPNDAPSTSSGSFKDDMSQQGEVVCVWNGRVLNTHLPHFLEIMYRCWSWWAMHNNTPQNGVQTSSVLEVPIDSQGAWKKSRSSPLAQGIWTHMQEAFDVQVVLLTDENTSSTLALSSRTEQKQQRPRQQFRATPRRQTPWVQDNDKSKPWFANAETAHALRDHVATRTFPRRTLSGCNSPPVSSQKSHARIGVLDRLGSRHLLNHKEIVAALQDLVSTPVAYKTFEKASFEQQIDFYTSIDILVSPHGAQLSGVPFMPTCGAVLELLPKAYHCQYFFGSLTTSANLTSTYLYLSDGDPWEETRNSTQSKRTREVARGAQLCPPVPSIVSSVQALLRNWESCCYSQR